MGRLYPKDCLLSGILVLQVMKSRGGKRQSVKGAVETVRSGSSRYEVYTWEALSAERMTRVAELVKRTVN